MMPLLDRVVQSVTCQTMYRCMSDYRSRDREFDQGPCPILSWRLIIKYSPPFSWLIQKELLLCHLQAKICAPSIGYPLVQAFLGTKSVVRWTDRPDMTITIDLDVKQQTNKKLLVSTITLANYVGQIYEAGSAVAQWKGAWLKTEGPRVRALRASLRCGHWARHIYHSLVLVQPSKTRPCLAERLLMGRKESNQNIYEADDLRRWHFHFWLTL